jgi:molecular chaperone HtpG
LIGGLEAMAEEQPDQYRAFWSEFGPFIKEGIASDPASKDDLLPLLVLPSTKSDGDMITLAQYVQRMPADQPAIYYVLGEDLKSVARSPHLDYFKAYDIEVLYLVEPIDSFMIVALQEYEGKPLKNVDDAGLELPKRNEAKEEGAQAVPEADFNRLVGRFVKVLGDRVVEVRESQVLKDNPCRLVSPDGAPLREMSRVYRMLGQEFEMPKRILELNRGHPIMANLAHLLAERPEAAVIDPAIEQLFEDQLLMEGLLANPTEMIPRIEQLLEAATARAGG